MGWGGGVEDIDISATEFSSPKFNHHVVSHHPPHPISSSNEHALPDAILVGTSFAKLATATYMAAEESFNQDSPEIVQIVTNAYQLVTN